MVQHEFFLHVMIHGVLVCEVVLHQNVLVQLEKPNLIFYGHLGDQFHQFIWIDFVAVFVKILIKEWCKMIFEYP